MTNPNRVSARAVQRTDCDGPDRLGPHRAHRPPKARDKIPALRMMPNSTKATAAKKPMFRHRKP